VLIPVVELPVPVADEPPTPVLVPFVELPVPVVDEPPIPPVLVLVVGLPVLVVELLKAPRLWAETGRVKGSIDRPKMAAPDPTSLTILNRFIN